MKQIRAGLRPALCYFLAGVALSLIVIVVLVALSVGRGVSPMLER